MRDARIVQMTPLPEFSATNPKFPLTEEPEHASLYLWSKSPLQGGKGLGN